jgi:DNA-binding CsgD family transcriptional regulator
MREPDVEESDMRAIVQLLGEVAALPGGLMGKRCHLLDGLCGLSGATEWKWALFRRAENGLAAECLNFLRCNPRTPLVIPMTLPEEDRGGFDLSLLPPPVSGARVIVSWGVPVAAVESRIALCRGEEFPPYSDREIHLASLVLDEIPWLHWQDRTPRQSNVSLSPREQLIFDLLFLGLGRKDIAAQLGISPGTVAGYVRNLYRQFGVNSQTALMRCRR